MQNFAVEGSAKSFGSDFEESKRILILEDSLKCTVIFQKLFIKLVKNEGENFRKCLFFFRNDHFSPSMGSKIKSYISAETTMGGGWGS